MGLALAMASGQKVAAWARENQVAARTARTWSRSPEVREQVDRIRSRVIDRVVGRLSKNATAAADEIARLAKKATSEAVRLQASRAVLAEMMTVASYPALHGRMAELERMVRANSQLPTPGDPSPAAGPESDPSGPPA